MKPKTFLLRSQSLPPSPLMEVIVKPRKVDRSAAQHRLYFLWVTILAGEQGLTKEEIHEDLKKRLLLPIYERDDADFALSLAAVRNVHKAGHKDEAKSLARQIVKLTSTTTATLDQFTEYLNEIEKDSANRGIFLPHPEDRYREAMGR